MSNKLTEIESLLVAHKPKAVKVANVDRAAKLVAAIKQIETLRAEVVREIEVGIKPIQKELRQHQRQLEKMFTSVLPEQKKPARTKEKYQHLGLKNYQVDYIKTWRLQHLHEKPTSEEILRKSVGDYNKTAFSRKIQAMKDAGLIKVNAAGKLLVGELPAGAEQ